MEEVEVILVIMSRESEKKKAKKRKRKSTFFDGESWAVQRCVRWYGRSSLIKLEEVESGES